MSSLKNSKAASRNIRRNAISAATALVIAAIAIPAAAADRINVAALDQAGTETFSRFIVKYRTGSPQRANAQRVDASLRTAIQGLASSVRVKNGNALGLARQLRMAIGADVVRTSRKLSKTEAEVLMRQLAADPNVEYVEPEIMLVPYETTPDDTDFDKQWDMGTGDGGINATNAWDKASGEGVVVAVIDTGITAHGDLDDNVIAGYDFITDATTSRDGDGRDDDPSDEGDWYLAGECGKPSGYNSTWHGTHVAGTIAAVANNANGIAGVAHGARIQPVRVLGKCGGSSVDIADAIIWASGGAINGVPNNATPAEVINMSLGSPGPAACPNSFKDAIDAAIANGSVVVVAAGNSNGTAANYTMTSCGNVISVGSVTSTGARSSFSNHGAAVDVAAPGSAIYSTINSGRTTPGAGSYGTMSGTSMAAPHVAGVAALVQSVAAVPLTHAEMEQLLIDTARAFPLAPDKAIGAGIVDANAAVDAVLDGANPPANNPPVANFSSSASGLTVTFTDSSTDADGTIVSRTWDFGDGTSSTSTNPSKSYSAGGTYTVKLTVTDDDGATNSKSSSITVTAPSSAVDTLSNGVAKTGLAGTTGSSKMFKMSVPSGATNLKFATSGGTGDVDMYVKFGSEPTTSTHDCGPYLDGNNETCTFASPLTGTYYVLLSGWSDYSGVSLIGSYTTGAQTYTNGTDADIKDGVTVESKITVSGRTGNASSKTSVGVNIQHTYRGDLKIQLIAPDGTAYLLKSYNAYDSADNVSTTYTVDASSETLNGDWKLRVTDSYVGDTGKIDSWSITF